MRETRTSGSEGGAEVNAVPTPIGKTVIILDGFTLNVESGLNVAIP